MANRIDTVQNGITPKPARESSEARSNAGVRSDDRSGSPSETSAAGARDTVVLTEQGQRLEQMEKAAAAAPAVDRARVDAVKADIASGNYKIDVENIADILIRTESEFNG